MRDPYVYYKSYFIIFSFLRINASFTLTKKTTTTKILKSKKTTQRIHFHYTTDVKKKKKLSEQKISNNQHQKKAIPIELKHARQTLSHKETIQQWSIQTQQPLQRKQIATTR